MNYGIPQILAPEPSQIFGTMALLVSSSTWVSVADMMRVADGRGLATEVSSV